MSKYRTELDSIKNNLNYLQLINDTLNDLIKSITSGVTDNSFNNITNLNLIDYISSDNYLNNEFLELDTNTLLIDKLFIKINDAIKLILNLEIILNKLESNNPTPSNELIHSQIVSNLKYIISVLRQDFTLKISLAKVLKTTNSDDELQRIRFLWLDSPVSESNYDFKSLYNTRLGVLKTLLNN